MNINDFVIPPGSKTGTSVRLKAKAVRELQLKKVQLENQEIEKKLQQLQSNMSREKKERKKSSAYHWKSGQARVMSIQAQVLSQSKENNNKVSSGKIKLQLVQEQIPDPVQKPYKHEMANAVAQKEFEVKGVELCEIKSALLPGAGKLEVVDHFLKEVNLNERKINHEQEKAKSKCQELSSESSCTSLENQDKRLLLNGTFNEDESAKSFQEALLQWRKGNHDHREPPLASGVLSGTVGIGEVQTNCAVMKEPIHIEFKKDDLSYMEKLLLKKYRRTPVDQVSDSYVKDLRPPQTPSVPQAVTEGGDDDIDDDINDLTAEEVKRYWTSVFPEKVPNTVSERVESSLRIEFLDNDLEECSNFLVMEAEALGMNKQGEAERTDWSHTKAKSLLLQDVARRQKSVSTQYWGLEGFFVGAAPKEVMLEAYSPQCADSSPMDSSIPLPGGGKWVTERSLSEYADGSVVEGVLKSQMNRPSSGLDTQKRISPMMVAWRSNSGNDSRRPCSTNMLNSKLTGNCPTDTEPRPKSSPLAMFRVGAEVSTHKCLDTQDEYLWEYAAEQEALFSLEKELESYTSSEECCRLTSEDVTSSSRHLEKKGRNRTDFLELDDHSRADTLRCWDEGQGDEEEETLEDKQQVLALQ